MNTQITLMSVETKEEYMRTLDQEIEKGLVDPEWIEPLKEINKHDFICSTMCCYGHEEDESPWLRCITSLRTDEFIMNVIKPMQDKYTHKISTGFRVYPDSSIEYMISFGNWNKTLPYFLKVLDSVDSLYRGDISKVELPKSEVDIHYVTNSINEVDCHTHGMRKLHNHPEFKLMSAEGWMPPDAAYIINTMVFAVEKGDDFSKEEREFSNEYMIVRSTPVLMDGEKIVQLRVLPKKK